MKLSNQIRVIITSTDVKKIDLEIKKVKLLLEGKSSTKVTVFVKKKKQKFYTVLKSPQKYKRAKNTFCSYIYEAMLSTKMDFNSDLNLLLLSQLKEFYAQNTNIGLKILTKVVRSPQTNKSLKLSTKLQNRFLRNKKRSEYKKNKLAVIPRETPQQHINLFVNKFIKNIKSSNRETLKNRIIEACVRDSLNSKFKKKESKAKMIFNQKLAELKRKQEMMKAMMKKKAKKLYKNSRKKKIAKNVKHSARKNKKNKAIKPNVK